MPDFTYNTNIPLGSDNPSNSAPQFFTNFNSTDGIVNVDLIGFNTSDGTGGFHQKSTYVAQGSDPGSASGQLVEYSKTSSGSTELFFQRDAVATPIQLTLGTIVNAPNGQTFLPGGLLLKWGNKFPTSATGSSIPVVYASVGLTNFPNGGYVAFAIGNGNNRIYDVSGVTSTTGFTIIANTPLGSGDTFFWIVIGH